MARCSRCLLHKSLKIVNISILLYGVALIIYSLWLDRKWRTYVAHFLPTSFAPNPWFIYTCLGVGIAVCFSSLFGSVVSNHFIGTFTLSAYIVTIGCLVFLEAAVIDIIFFKMDLAAEIIQGDVGDYIEEIESFVKFHIMLSRVFILVIFVAQTNIVVIAVILWGILIRREATLSDGMEPHTSHFTESFLVPISNLPQIDGSIQQSNCTTCGNLQRPQNISPSPRPTFFSYIYTVIISPFQPTHSIS